MSPRTDTAKDAALRIVGRTIVNFQRLEHNLKLAARLGPLQGTIQKVQRDIERRRERAPAFTLGQAIRAWLNYCDGQPAAQYETPDLFDISVQMTFTLESYPEFQARHAEALCELLEVRNDLIHSRLAKFDWESDELCENLVAELEQVNTSISEQIAYTSSFLQSIAELHKEHAQSLAEQFAAGAHTVTEAMPNTSLERTRGG